MRRPLLMHYRLPLLLLLAALVPYPTEASHPRIEPCPENRVCAISVWDSCTINGVKADMDNRGYLREADTTCVNGDYRGLLAELEIEPLSLLRWTFVMTFFKNELMIYKTGFKFGSDAEFAFINEAAVNFTWKKGDNVHSSVHSMIKSEAASPNHDRFSFEIEAEGEKLITIFGAEDIDLSMNGKAKMKMQNPRFAQLLDQKTVCDLSEITRVCYGGACGEITVSNSTAVCPYRLWQHSISDGTGWKSVDGIRCSWGRWSAEWSGGTLWVDSSLEFQCSAGEPSEAPAAAALIVGCSVGGGIGLIAVIVGVILFLRYRRRRDCENKTTGRTVPSFRIRDLPRNESGRTPGEAGTPRGGDRLSEHTAQTDISGLQTEILEERTATAKLGEEPPEPFPGTPTGTVVGAVPTLASPVGPAGAAGAATPTLPRGYAI